MRRFLIIALSLLAVLAVLLVVNAVIVGNETKAASAEGASRVLDLPGGDLHVTDRGPRDAPTILLVHCYTCSIDYWQRLAPLLVRDHRVIAVDLLGHGSSEMADDGYSMEHQADTIAEALDALDAKPVLAVGQSLGGPVSTALAQRHPDKVRGLVIMDSSSQTKYVDLPLTAKLARMPVIGPALKQVAPDSTIHKELSKAFHEGFEFPDSFVDDVKAMTYTSFAESYEGGRDFTEADRLDDRIASTRLPVTVIFGADDRIVNPESADDYRDIPGAKVVVLPGIGHTPQMEAPARSAALVLAQDRESPARP
ncbi:MAG TPA: alpha/beta fold hydrolase [Thermoleophilaceae bacterium]|nr:alpha/beta fold hydrolase [Thermoleophilaceae bacterium]